MLVVLHGARALGQEEVEVTFHVNDALERNKFLSDVAIGVATTPTSTQYAAQGKTDANGQLKLKLAPRRYWVTYRHSDHVTVERAATEVSGSARHIMTTLSPLLEATDQAHARPRSGLHVAQTPTQVAHRDSPPDSLALPARPAKRWDEIIEVATAVAMPIIFVSLCVYAWIKVERSGKRRKP